MSFGYETRFRPRSKYETLERMLNKTTLSVQRVTHRHIIERGQHAFVQTTSEETYDKEKAVQIALDQAEMRFTRELKCALSRVRVQKEEERVKALRAQREYYEKHMARVAEQRDQLEKEQFQEIRRQSEIEKATALRELEERLKREAASQVAAARQEERDRVREDLKEEHDQDVADAINRCEEAARLREAKVVEDVKEECAAEKAAALKQQAGRHAKVVEALNRKYDHLLDQLERSLKYNRQLEEEFQYLQSEYRRFLDNTDGHFHSDYLLKLRKHGIQLSCKGLPKFEMEDVSDLKKMIKPHSAVL